MRNPCVPIQLVCVDKPSIHLPRLPPSHVFLLLCLNRVSVDVLFIYNKLGLNQLYTRCLEPDT